jgi:hypothetical protein
MSTLKLNYLQHPSSSTTNITLASTGAVAVNGAMTGAGLDLITPTSIAYSGGSASVSGGAVTFSAASTVSVNNCFSSTYDNYRIVFRGSQSAASNLEAMLRGTCLGFREGMQAKST